MLRFNRIAEVPDSWRPGTSNYRAREISMFTVYGVYTVFVIVTLVMFLVQSRNPRSELSKRSVKLVSIQAVGCFIVGTLGLVSTALNEWACFIKLWLYDIGFTIVLSALAARAMQLIIISKIHSLTGQVHYEDIFEYTEVPGLDGHISSAAEGKLYGINVNDLEPAEWHGMSVVGQSGFAKMSHGASKTQQEIQAELKKYTRRRHYVTDRRMIIFITIATSVAIAVSAAINAVSKDYTIKPVTIACSMYWELIPVTILIGVYLLIVFPILLWQVWGLKDAYGIRRDLLICDTVGIVCLAVAFIWEFGLHQVSSIWSCLFFVWVAMLLIHISSVVVPLIKAIGHSKRTKHQIRNRHSTASSSDSDSVHANDRGATKIRRSDFNRVLDDPYEYETFREFAASCFCSELTAFIDEYQSLKTKTVTALGNADSPILETSSSWRSSLSLDSPNGDFYGDVSVHPQQFAYNKPASKAKPLTLSTGISVSILETAKAAYPQHEFTENTQFPTTVLDRLVRIFSIYLNLNSYMALNVPSVMVRKIQDQLDRKQMSLPILDEVKDEVLFMLYTDVFTRYQRTR